MRQLNADDDGNFQDLDAVVADQEVTAGNRAEAASENAAPTRDRMSAGFCEAA